MRVSIFTAATGDFPEAGRYIQNLFFGLSEHFQFPFTFHCITDKEIPDIEENQIHYHPQARPVWGWWNLMELYRPDAPWSDSHVLMFGLDTVIRGNIDWMIQEWPTYMRPVRESLGLKGAYNGTYADGAVCLPPGMHYNEVWETYLKEVDPKDTWEQKRAFPMHPYVTEVIQRKYKEQPHFWQEILPGKLCSYREPTPKIEEPDEPLVIFHGSPRPHEAISEAPWIKKHFR